MHKSLSPGVNRVLVLAWGVGVAGLAFVTSGAVYISLLIGAALGAVAGSLQRRALRTEAAALAATATALEVRRAMTSSGAGKVAISLSWICAALLLLTALLFYRYGPAAASWVAGYLAFMFVRDAVAYGALRYVMVASQSTPVGTLDGRRQS